MKILIVQTKQLFKLHPSQAFVTDLQQQLITAGYESEILSIPFKTENPEQITSQILMMRALELENVDCVIALQFPAYFIRHPHKIIWLLEEHHHPFDFNKPLDSSLGKVIHNADIESFTESRHLFTSSISMQKQLAHYHTLKTTILPPHSTDPSHWPHTIKALLS